MKFDGTVDELKDHLAALDDPNEIEAYRDGEDRATAIEAIDARLSQMGEDTPGMVTNRNLTRDERAARSRAAFTKPKDEQYVAPRHADRDRVAAGEDATGKWVTPEVSG